MAKEAYTTKPELENSIGHDRYEYLLRKALESAGFKVETAFLKPQNTDDKLEKFLWESVKSGKHKLTEHHRRKKKGFSLADLIGKAISACSEPVRASNYVRKGLTRSYREYIAQNTARTIVTSHYLGLDLENELDENGNQVRKNVLITPDGRLHDATLDALLKSGARIVIPQAPTAKSLRREHPEFIPSIVGNALPVSKELNDIVQERLKRQKKLIDTSSDEPKVHNILITLGGSGAEFDQVQEVVKQILENPVDKFGFNYKLTVLCGDISKSHNKQLYEQLLNLNEFGGMLELVSSRSRDDELDEWYKALLNPAYDTVITRPNEMLTIAPALGFRTILLDPFQKHEEESVAMTLFNAQSSTNMTMYKWLLNDASEFTGFENGIDIAGNYQRPDFWCKCSTDLPF